MIKRFTINHVERSYNGVFITTEHGDLEHTTTFANTLAVGMGLYPLPRAQFCFVLIFLNDNVWFYINNT